jgi:hypothetical protein
LNVTSGEEMTERKMDCTFGKELEAGDWWFSWQRFGETNSLSVCMVSKWFPFESPFDFSFV